mgnify:CR=1 FL=1
MKENYDFSKGQRGKYAAQYQEGTNVVILDPELLAHFPDAEAVNDALRELLDIRKNAAGDHDA